MTRMRRSFIDTYDGWIFGFATTGLLGIVLAQGTDLRRFSNALGVAVFGLLVWRLVSTWKQLTVLEHALTGLLALSPLVSAIASWHLLSTTDGDLPPNPLLWAVILHRVACLVLVIFWPHWIGRRMSPFRRIQQDSVTVS